VDCANGTNELEAQRRFVQRGVAYGSKLSSQQTFALLGLESSLPPCGRTRKTLRSPENDSRPLFCESTDRATILEAAKRITTKAVIADLIQI
jgi:hypothetical protein